MAINRYYSPFPYESRVRFLSLGVKCVFISHQKKDSSAARKVADYLEKAGIDIYFDEYDGNLKVQHQNGDPRKVTQAIIKGINDRSHMVVVVSPNTILSSWVPFEIGYGYDKTEVRALCLKGILKGKIPEYVRAVPIIRDIYDLNNFVSLLSGKSKELLLENKNISHYGSGNPLSDAMDDLINDQY